MTILILIIGISVLILVHEFGHFLAAKFFHRWVEEFGIGFPPRLFGKKIGETVYSVNLLPFGGFVKIHGERPEPAAEGTLLPDASSDVKPERSFAALSISRRAIIIGAGVVMNFLMGWVVLSAIFMAGVPDAVVITAIMPDTPAALAGIHVNDLVADYRKASDFIAYVNAHKGEAITLSLIREGKPIAVTVTPRLMVPPGQGALGIGLTDLGQPKLGLVKSVTEGWKTAWTVIGAIFASLYGLIRGLFAGAPSLEGFVGPVGIFQIANQTAKFGIAHLLELIGLISLNLVVLNVLPIPALDGGRLFFLLIEKLKGSPISAKREGVVNAIGFGLLILLMVVITVRDVVKLF